MFQELLEKLAIALDARSIPYMVIGGQAVLLYGEPRLTKDIDITLGRAANHVGEVLELIRSLGWKALVPKPTEFAQETMVLPCQDPRSGIRVDFIFSQSVYEQEALKRVHQVKVRQATVRFASLEDVIVHKIVAGRPRDLEDVRTLLARDHQADLTYINKWLVDFGQALHQPLFEQLEEIRRSVTDPPERQGQG